MPDDGLEVLKQHDAIYFGSVGSQEVPDHISLRELRIRICLGLNLEVCTRPAWILPGVKSCLVLQDNKDVDWYCIRQNTLGEYAGEGTLDRLGGTATDIAIYNGDSIKRIAHYAFKLARTRSKKVAFGTKSNAMPNGMVFWDENIQAVANEYPDVRCERVLTDALLYRMLIAPKSLDVILGTNLHLDFLTDAAAAVMGSLGLAPSGNIDPTRKNPPMFEPTHGSGYDLIGTGYANPIGAILSGGLMLEYLGEMDAARKLRQAVETVTSLGIKTPDIGGKSKASEVTSAVCQSC